MTSATFFALFALIGIVNGAAINSGTGNVAYEIPIPRGYTADQYFKSVVDYWTPERMADAKPLFPVISTKQITPFVSDSKTDEPEQLLTPAVPASKTIARGENTPTACGKIFFEMNKLRYVCSGSVCNANNRATIITAGHCVFNNTGKNWAENLIFVPDYHNNGRPFGSFVARRLATKDQWKNGVDYNNDVAIVTVNRNEDGELPQDIVDAFGIVLNVPKAAHTHAFGFPMNIASGETMSTCATSTTAASIFLMSSFKGLSLTCGMTGGASGGPWLRNYNTNNRIGEQCSLTSFGHSLAPGKINGPHFTQDNMGSLWQANQNA